MPLKKFVPVVVSVLVALTAGLLTRMQFVAPYAPCEPSSLDAILDGGQLELAPDCILMLDTQREITGEVTITGGMLHSGGLDRVLYIHEEAVVTLNNVTVLSGAADIEDKQGGGIYNAGYLMLAHSKILSNKAREGGAIYNVGTLHLRHSTIARNSAESGGGIYVGPNGTLRIENSVIEDNGVRDGMGGGLYNVGATLISESTISSNRVRSTVFSADRGSSGGIYNDGEMVLRSSQVSNNTAIYAGGIGNGDNGEMTIVRSTISDNTALRTDDYGGYGGGVNNRNFMLIIESRIEANAGSDEGIGVDNAGALVITQSIIQHNRCLTDNCRGLGLFQFKGAVAAQRNYWGAADGPGEDGPGSGDGIVGLEANAYSPFLSDLPEWAINQQ